MEVVRPSVIFYPSRRGVIVLIRRRGEEGLKDLDFGGICLTPLVSIVCRSWGCRFSADVVARQRLDGYCLLHQTVEKLPART